MPAYEPGATIEIVIPKDADKPHPATFLCRSLSCRESLAARQMIKDTPDTVEGIEQLVAMIESHLVGWKNVQISYESGRLLDVIGINDVWPLAWAIAWQVTLPEKKD